MQLEDYEDEGVVPYGAFEEAYETLELNVDKDLKEYLMFMVYQRSESLEKMRYQVLLDIIDGKVMQG